MGNEPGFVVSHTGGEGKKKKSIEGYGYGISWSHIKTEMMMAVKWWWWHYTASAVVTEHGR